MKHIYKEDYTGYVYLWFDKKRKMFYLGSHLGSVEDSYKGSGTRFKNAYKKRPDDFKIRILEHDKGDVKTLRLKEQRWLNMIKDEKLNNVYYNLVKLSNGGKPQRLVNNVCVFCNSVFKIPFKDRRRKTCSPKCFTEQKQKGNSGKNNPMYGKTMTEATLKKLRGKKAWNKGLPNPTAAENGRKSAKKQSATVTGRRKKNLPNGKWCWIYPS